MRKKIKDSGFKGPAGKVKVYKKLFRELDKDEDGKLGKLELVRLFCEIYFHKIDISGEKGKGIGERIGGLFHGAFRKVWSQNKFLNADADI